MRVACFATSVRSHIGGVLSVAAELAKAGAEVRVWTDPAFKLEVAAAGAQFSDLFAGRSLCQLGDVSQPRPARYVTFAAIFADSLASEVRAWAPNVVVAEGFALIGRIVAEQLGRPWLLINSGHCVNGACHRDVIAREFPGEISGACWNAVEILKSRYGLTGASPYSFISDPSPWANIHVEPAEWWDGGKGHEVNNIEFFGSLSGRELQDGSRGRADREARRIYASLGTVVWRYWKDEAAAVLRSVAEGVALVEGASLTIGLGGAGLAEPEIAGLKKYGATVIPYADQPAILSCSDAFITHHGLGSTHEAVAARVPMLSYPFVGDEPSLAGLSQSFGLAKPLRNMALPLSCPPAPETVAQSLEALLADARIEERLDTAWEWERRTMAERPRVAKRLLEFALC
jgi:UDP:flavonoid glycosyltransferase YjiC (YdhE family)